MRIDLHPRLKKRLETLSRTARTQVAESLRALDEGFGNPHLHSGLGIRRLKKDLFECRAVLKLRVIFFPEKDLLTAYDVMPHDEVKAWLTTF